jgi:hypothetical protein
MKPVLEWVKSNVLIVVFAAVAIASLGLGWWFSSSLNASVRSEASARAAKLNELAALERSTVTLNLPGREPKTSSVVINQQILDQYREISEKLRADADRVRARALEINRAGHGLIAEGVFPEPRATERETVPFRLHRALLEAYDRLLAEVNAGMPPAPDRVVEDLQRREMQFIQSTLRKTSREALDERERRDLEEELVRSRLAIYGEEAQRATIYVSASSLDLPPSPEGRPLPTLGEMFDWQWRYWITRDLLEAFVDASAAANDGAPAGIVRSPVKRVLSMRIEDVPWASRRAAGSAGSTQRGGGFGGMGGFGAAGGDGTAVDDAGLSGGDAPTDGSAGAVPGADATAEAPRDFARSFTGRQSNAVYDVRRVDVVLVAATSQLPFLFDALAKKNFITILDVGIQPADPFEAASSGFIYGRDPVSTVRLQLETVWLREWIAPLMPPEVRTALGIPAPTAETALGLSAG